MPCHEASRTLQRLVGRSLHGRSLCGRVDAVHCAHASWDLGHGEVEFCYCIAMLIEACVRIIRISAHITLLRPIGSTWRRIGYSMRMKGWSRDHAAADVFQDCSGGVVSQKTACINDCWSIYDIIIYNIQSNRIYKHQHSVAFIILYRPLRPLCVSEQLQDWAACWHSSLFLTEVGWRNHAVKHSDQVIVEAALIGKHLQKNMLMRLCHVILMRYISLHPPKLM